MWGRRRRRLPPRPPRPPTPPPAHVDRFVVDEENNPFDGDAPGQEDLRDIRNEAAAALLDEDTYGYVMLRLKVEKGSNLTGEIVFAGHVPSNYRPAFRRASERLIRGLE